MCSAAWPQCGPRWRSGLCSRWTGRLVSPSLAETLSSLLVPLVTFLWLGSSRAPRGLPHRRHQPRRSPGVSPRAAPVYAGPAIGQCGPHSKGTALDLALWFCERVAADGPGRALCERRGGGGQRGVLTVWWRWARTRGFRDKGGRCQRLCQREGPVFLPFGRHSLGCWREGRAGCRGQAVVVPGPCGEMAVAATAGSVYRCGRLAAEELGVGTPSRAWGPAHVPLSSMHHVVPGGQALLLNKSPQSPRLCACARVCLCVFTRVNTGLWGTRTCLLCTRMGLCVPARAGGYRDLGVTPCWAAARSGPVPWCGWRSVSRGRGRASEAGVTRCCASDLRSVPGPGQGASLHRSGSVLFWKVLQTF